MCFFVLLRVVLSVSLSKMSIITLSRVSNHFPFSSLFSVSTKQLVAGRLLSFSDLFIRFYMYMWRHFSQFLLSLFLRWSYSWWWWAQTGATASFFSQFPSNSTSNASYVLLFYMLWRKPCSPSPWETFLLLSLQATIMLWQSPLLCWHSFIPKCNM